MIGYNIIAWPPSLIGQDDWTTWLFLERWSILFSQLGCFGLDITFIVYADLFSFLQE